MSHQSPDAKRVNNVTFSLSSPKEGNGVGIESPRNKRYETRGNYDQFSLAIDKRIEYLKHEIEISATSKANQARSHALQSLSKQI